MIELNSASGASYFIEQYSVFKSETTKSGHNAFLLGMALLLHRLLSLVELLAIKSRIIN